MLPNLLKGKYLLSASSRHRHARPGHSMVDIIASEGDRHSCVRVWLAFVPSPWDRASKLLELRECQQCLGY